MACERAIQMFERVGLRAVYVQRDDFYMLVPSGDERARIGVTTISSRAMGEIDQYLSSPPTARSIEQKSSS